MVLFSEFACNLGQGFRPGNADAYRNVCPEAYLLHHFPHHLHQVMVGLVAVQI